MSCECLKSTGDYRRESFEYQATRLALDWVMKGDRIYEDHSELKEKFLELEKENRNYPLKEYLQTNNYLTKSMNDLIFSGRETIPAIDKYLYNVLYDLHIFKIINNSDLSKYEEILSKWGLDSRLIEKLKHFEETK